MYLHQIVDWPNFRYDAGALSTQLAQVRHSQGRLLGRINDWGIEVQLGTSANVTVSEIISNSQIEGENLPAEEVRSSLARRLGLSVAGLVLPSHHVDGVVEMMLDATRQYNQPITRDRLLGWHAALFPTGRSGILPIQVGAYRKHSDDEPMRVISGRMGRTGVHFEAPSSASLPEGMDKLIQYINQPDDTDGLLRAGIVHLWFLTLHPFDDGNGRIARALTDYMLAHSDQSQQRFYSISTAFLNKRKQYYRNLEVAQKGSLDITNWLKWFLGTVAEAIERANTQMNETFIQSKFWHRHQDAVFNHRQIKILKLVWAGYKGKLTSFRYANICQVSQDTATRDINDLIEKGALRKGSAGGRATTYDLVKETND